MSTTSRGGPDPAADPAFSARANGERVTHSRGFEWFARAGLAARGFIYALVGALALEVAFGIDAGSTESQQGALRQVAQESFGKALLVLVAIGLAGYATWRLVRAAVGRGPESGEDSGLERIAGVASGIAYFALCATAISILAGSGSGSSGGSTEGVLGWTGGPWIVGIAGAIIVGVGLYQAYKGISKEFLKDSKTEQMSRSVKRGFTALGVFGHVARAVIFVLIGYFLIKAAVDYDPKAPVSVDGALTKLSDASYGPVLLGIVAAGLFGFGLYSFADARFRRI